jgi:hypothetical protein
MCPGHSQPPFYQPPYTSTIPSTPTFHNQHLISIHLSSLHQHRESSQFLLLTPRVFIRSPSSRSAGLRSSPSRSRSSVLLTHSPHSVRSLSLHAILVNLTRPLTCSRTVSSASSPCSGHCTSSGYCSCRHQQSERAGGQRLMSDDFESAYGDRVRAALCVRRKQSSGGRASFAVIQPTQRGFSW